MASLNRFARIIAACLRRRRRSARAVQHGLFARRHTRRHADRRRRAADGLRRSRRRRRPRHAKGAYSGPRRDLAACVAARALELASREGLRSGRVCGGGHGSAGGARPLTVLSSTSAQPSNASPNASNAYNKTTTRVTLGARGGACTNERSGARERRSRIARVAAGDAGRAVAHAAWRYRGGRNRPHRRRVRQ